MSQKLSNNARAALVGSLSAIATTLTIESTKADLFPVANRSDWLTPGDWFKATIENNLGEVEIIYVGLRNAGSGLLGNILRGQEGTTARAYSAGAVVGIRITALDVQNCLAGVFEEVTADTITVTGNVTAAEGTNPGHVVVKSQLDGVKRLPPNTTGLVSGEVYLANANFTLNLGLTPGDLIGVINDSAAAITAVEGAGVTLRFSGFAVTGNRQLAPRAFIGIYCKAANEYYISGAGLS